MRPKSDQCSLNCILIINDFLLLFSLFWFSLNSVLIGSMEADETSFVQKLSASTNNSQMGSQFATPSPVPNHFIGLGDSPQSTTAASRYFGLKARTHWKPNLEESPIADPLSLAESLERLTSAEKKLSQFESWLLARSRTAGDRQSERDARSCRAELRLLEFGVDKAKRVCRKSAIAQPPADIRELFEKVLVQLATTRRQCCRQLTEGGTSAAARENESDAIRLHDSPQNGNSLHCESHRQQSRVGFSAREKCRCARRAFFEDKSDASKDCGIQQSTNSSRDHAMAEHKQSQLTAPIPLPNSTQREPLPISAIRKQSFAHNPLSGIATVAGGYAVRELEDRLLSVRIPLNESTFGASYIALIYCRQNQTRRASFTRASIRSTTKWTAHRTSRSRLRLHSVSHILVQLAPTPTMLLLLEKRSTSVLSDTTTAAVEPPRVRQAPRSSFWRALCCDCCLLTRRERVSSRVAHSRILLAGPERMRRKQEARN